MGILELLDQKDSIDITEEVQTEIEKETPDVDKKASYSLEQAQDRSSRLNFAAMGIPVGARLQFTRDSNIEVEVADSINHVLYLGEQTTLSNLTKKLVGYIRPPYGILVLQRPDFIRHLQRDIQGINFPDIELLFLYLAANRHGHSEFVPVCFGVSGRL